MSPLKFIPENFLELKNFKHKPLCQNSHFDDYQKNPK